MRLTIRCVSVYFLAPCSPGSYSSTGLPPCRLCPLGHYSEIPGMLACIPCLGNNVTVTEGADSSELCIGRHLYLKFNTL